MIRALFLVTLLALLLVPLADAPARPRLAGHFKSVIAGTDASLYQVKLFEDRGVYACGADGYFVWSGDSGESWETMQIQEGIALRVMHWPSRRTAVIAGRKAGKNHLWISTDRAATFDAKDVDTDLPIRDFAFFGLAKGFMVAGSVQKKDGTWRVSKDGGRTYQAIESVAYSNPARALLGICRAGKKSLFVVGSHVESGYVGEAAKSLLYKTKQGSVLRSTDEGQNWEVVDAGNDAGTLLYDVDFADEKLGWVVGERGFAAFTRDGGKTWKKVDTGTEERLNAVQVIDKEAAYAVGENGTAIGTNDGGETIVTFKTGTKRDLKDLSFTDERTGFVVGTSGTVLRFVRDY